MESIRYLYALLAGAAILFAVCVIYFIAYKRHINKVLKDQTKPHIKLSPPYKVVSALAVFFLVVSVCCLTFAVINLSMDKREYIPDYSPFSINSFSNVNTVLDRSLEESGDLDDLLSQDDLRAALPFGGFEVNFKDGAFNNLTFTLDLSDHVVSCQKIIQTNYAGQLFAGEKVISPTNIFAGNTVPLHILHDTVETISDGGWQQFPAVVDAESVTFSYHGKIYLVDTTELSDSAYLILDGNISLLDTNINEGDYYTFSIVFENEDIRFYVPTR